jgi:dolichyl-phosphate-mannose--protein O-mannosyl transferase
MALAIGIGRITKQAVLIGGGATAFAGAIRFIRLGNPGTIIPLDEAYYVPDAAAYLAHGSENSFAVHPPVGKWLIAAGMKVFGNNPFGWRASAALVGTLSILVLYLLALRLWNRPWLAGGVALLLAVDGLSFVQSRVAMLDVFLTFFVLLSVWLLIEDKVRTPLYHTGPRWWRLAAGMALGLAVATKWAAVPAAIVIFQIAFLWDDARWRSGEQSDPLPSTVPISRRSERPRWWRLASLIVTLLLLPMAVYVASYIPWFMDSSHYVPPPCARGHAQTLTTGAQSGGSLTRAWLCYQIKIFDYHKSLETFRNGELIQPYVARAWSWPWIGRPTVHFRDASSSRSSVAEIIGLPNPALWYPAFFLALPLCLWWAVRRRDATAALILATFAALYLPWLIVSRPLWLFYLAPAIPFLALMVGHTLHRMTVDAVNLQGHAVISLALLFLPFGPLAIQAVGSSSPGGLLWKIPVGVAMTGALLALSVKRGLSAARKHRVVGVYFGLAILLFAYMYPVLAAARISEGGSLGARSHHWLRLDCTEPGIKISCWL